MKTKLIILIPLPLVRLLLARHVVSMMDDKDEKKEFLKGKAEGKEAFSISEQLARQSLLGGDDINRALAEQFGMPVYENLTQFRISRERIKQVPYSYAKRNII